MKVILFEGPDKVGKTTLMMNIADKMAFGETDEFGSAHKPLVLGRAFGTHPLYGEDELNKLRSFRLKLEAKTIGHMQTLTDDYVLFIDRFHLSEKVYGQVFGRGWDQYAFEVIDRLLYNALLVFIKPSSPEAVFNMYPDDTGRLDGLTLDEYTKSVKLFEACFDESSIKNKCKAVLRNDDCWFRPDQYVEEAVANYLNIRG